MSEDVETGGALEGDGEVVASEVAIPENWKQTLPEDLRSDPILARFNDVPGMAKALISAQKMVGADKVAIPSADDKEAWGKVYDRLGRPESADGYELTAPENLPTDDGMIAAFRETAHGLGLSSGQATGLFDWFMGAEGARHGGIKDQIEALGHQNEAELRREWGAAYESKIELATGAAHALLGSDGIRDLTERGYGSDPFMMRLLAAVGERVVEGRVDGEGPRGMGRSPTEARAEIARLQGDQDFTRLYQDRSHPEHADAVARMSELYQQGYPGGDSGG